jgi:hypothetical protein
MSNKKVFILQGVPKEDTVALLTERAKERKQATEWLETQYQGTFDYYLDDELVLAKSEYFYQFISALDYLSMDYHDFPYISILLLIGDWQNVKAYRVFVGMAKELGVQCVVYEGSKED